LDINIPSSVANPATPISSPKVIYVIGADIQINNNIWTSDNGSVVIIAQKFGNKGGNIYINPRVTSINATIIADGALMNGEDAVAMNWLDPDDMPSLRQKLTINGRLLTYNTRGGSLRSDGASGLQVATGTAKCASIA
jgi:hypothetical protein